MKQESLFVVLGNQLFSYKHHKKHSDEFFMAEDLDLCTHYKYHKHKIMHFLISMREYRDLLRLENRVVHYSELNKEKGFFYSLEQVLKKGRFKTLKSYEVEDKFFEKQLIQFAEKQGVDLEFLESPMFMLSRAEFKEYLERSKRPFMKSFYEWQRRKTKVLMDGKDPVGGQFSYDSENRKKIPKKEKVARRALVEVKSQHIEPVAKLVDKHFSSHPGSTENYWIPVTQKQAKVYLKQFVSIYLDSFGDYQDAIDQRDPFLNHSIISPSINIGHLEPDVVIGAVEKKLVESHRNLNSIEGFIRQVLGWREFVRGIYQNYSEIQDEKNFFSHKLKLNHKWYEASTGVPPIDDAIKKALEYGYCHHIERLMLLSNFMLLLGIEPKEVHKWFMEMFVDSSDWVMGPNVYGMGQFSDGGIFATKPYISGSNYVFKMSHYSKGEEWAEAWDGLYWQFIETHYDFFKKNPRLSMMTRMLDKMDPDKKKRIFSLANQYRTALTK